MTAEEIAEEIRLSIIGLRWYCWKDHYKTLYFIDETITLHFMKELPNKLYNSSLELLYKT